MCIRDRYMEYILGCLETNLLIKIITSKDNVYYVIKRHDKLINFFYQNNKDLSYNFIGVFYYYEIRVEFNKKITYCV